MRVFVDAREHGWIAAAFAAVVENDGAFSMPRNPIFTNEDKIFLYYLTSDKKSKCINCISKANNFMFKLSFKPSHLFLL